MGGVVADGGKELPEGAEIRRVGYRYLPEQKGPNLLARMELTGPSSGALTYSLHVVDAEDADGRPLASQSGKGDGGDTVTFELVVDAGAEQRLGIYATSSAGDQEYDRCPPTGAFPVDQVMSEADDGPLGWEYGP